MPSPTIPIRLFLAFSLLVDNKSRRKKPLLNSAIKQSPSSPPSLFYIQTPLLTRAAPIKNNKTQSAAAQRPPSQFKARLLRRLSFPNAGVVVLWQPPPAILPQGIKKRACARQRLPPAACDKNALRRRRARQDADPKSEHSPAAPAI